MEDGLDVVAVGVDHEGGVVAAAVLGPQPGWTVVGRTGVHCGGVPASDSLLIASAKRDVRAGGDTVASGLAADAVQGEVVALAAPEQHVRVTFELAVSKHEEPKLGQRGFIHPAACLQVADTYSDVIDDVAHAGTVLKERRPWPLAQWQVKLVDRIGGQSSSGSLSVSVRGELM